MPERRVLNQAEEIVRRKKETVSISWLFTQRQYARIMLFKPLQSQFSAPAAQRRDSSRAPLRCAWRNRWSRPWSLRTRRALAAARRSVAAATTTTLKRRWLSSEDRAIDRRCRCRHCRRCRWKPSQLVAHFCYAKRRSQAPFSKRAKLFAFVCSRIFASKNETDNKFFVRKHNAFFENNLFDRRFPRSMRTSTQRARVSRRRRCPSRRAR